MKVFIQETVNNMMQYVREGEYCSCPYIFEDSDGKGLKMFTFLAMENEQTTVYGIGQVIACGVDGTIQCEEGNIFQNESDLIVIADDKKVTPEERDELYQTYYAALDAYISGEELDKEPINDAFRNIISEDALALYEVVCPEFVNTFIKEEE